MKTIVNNIGNCVVWPWLHTIVQNHSRSLIHLSTIPMSYIQIHNLLILTGQKQLHSSNPHPTIYYERLHETWWRMPPGDYNETWQNIASTWPKCRKSPYNKSLGADLNTFSVGLWMVILIPITRIIVHDEHSDISMSELILCLGMCR